jgi:hypothetical protein
MGMDSGGTPQQTGGAVGRRDFLTKAAVVGTGAFAMPMIVTVDPADAQALTSPPPQPPGSSTRPESPAVERASAARSAEPDAAGRRVSGRTELPRTGADIDRLVAAGLAATVGGASLVLWSADPGSKAAAPRSGDPELET